MNTSRVLIGLLPRYLVCAVASVLAMFGAQAEPLAPESAQAGQSATAVVQRFVDAYNAGDVKRFVEPLADQVQVYNYPGELRYEGKNNLGTRFTEVFAKTPKLHCKIIKRIALGDTVIDQERITGTSQGAVEQITIYTVEAGKISRIEVIK